MASERSCFGNTHAPIPVSGPTNLHPMTDLIGSALCHTPPRQYTQRPSGGPVHCHPLFLNPRSTVAVLCRGFQKVLNNHGVFNTITDILHDLRCLTAVAHFSYCKAHTEIPIYCELCRDVERRLESLPSTSGSGSRILEACRLAVMIFTELVLLNYTIETSNAAVLAAGIKNNLEDTAAEVETSQQTTELTPWILFMGFIAADSTQLSNWFKDVFARAQLSSNLRHYETTRRALTEFLWLDGILNQRLESLCAELNTRFEA